MINVDLNIWTTDLPAGMETRFASDVAVVTAAYESLQDMLNLRDWHIRILLPKDFDETVQDEVNKIGPVRADFGSDRIGGTVVGKLVTKDVERGHYTIVFNPELWRQLWPFGLEHLFQLNAMFHEFGHVLFADLYHQVLAVAESPSRADALSSLILELGRECQEEYIVDRLALDLLRTCVTVEVAGDDQTNETLECLAMIYHDQLIEKLEVVTHEWPGAVWNYRLHAIDLNQMVETILKQTKEMLILLIHVQAFRDVYDDTCLFEIDEYARTNASRLYFADLWTDFASVLQGFSLPLTPDEFQEADSVVYRASETLLMQLWKRLGLEPRMTEEGCFWSVSEPLS